MFRNRLHPSKLKAFCSVAALAFIGISLFGLFDSSEMHSKQLGAGVSFSNISNNGEHADMLEDLSAWASVGSVVSPTLANTLGTLILLFLCGALAQRTLYAHFTQQTRFISYRDPPSYFHAIQEAFARGILNGKAY